MYSVQLRVTTVTMKFQVDGVVNITLMIPAMLAVNSVMVDRINQNAR